MSKIQNPATRQDEQHEFLRQITIPEEDRAKYGMPRSQGGYRWFRSQNVVCLEKARRGSEDLVGSICVVGGNIERT
jgi:hypothetical protein